ncbi:unnamed protein product [Rotaria sordida]|uniref:Uncharacterized protein n=1 Tax=Rotaria sordida TaxID=392033 RepID=A0A813Q718_9BILA|nr:unnamed protein product [Rotaria sordida]CAF0853333.1 unnamed protein product [Rotaria sordida]
MCITTNTIYSFSVLDQDSINNIAMEHHSIDDISSPMDEYGSIKKTLSEQVYPVFHKRRFDSDERYFDWASKTNRPMEYLRGKRFWLFTKKDEQGNNPEILPNSAASSNTLSQGIWRSGIVGRRR